MVEIRKVMERDRQGTPRQVFPESHIEAILGLEEWLNDIEVGNGSSKVTEYYVRSLADETLKKAKNYADEISVEIGGSNQLYVHWAYKLADGTFSQELPTDNESPKYRGLRLDYNRESSSVPEDYQWDLYISPEIEDKILHPKEYTAGANIAISPAGVISATGGSGTNGVNQEYVDTQDQEILKSAKEYTYSKKEIDQKIISNFVKVGEVENND